MDETKEPAAGDFPRTFAWGAACVSCKTVLPPLRDTASLFFENGSVPCPKCGNGVDVWEVTKNEIRTYFGTFIGLGGLGANQTVFMFDLAPGQIKSLDFTEQGVPPSAVVVSVVYTAQGSGCFPIEMHSNEARSRSYKPMASVYGASLGNNPGPVKIAVLVTWIDELEEPESWTMLADAFQAATDNRFSRVVVPAYSAFEVSVGRLIRELLLNVTSKESVEEFMVRDLSAASAVNVLVPFICRTLGVKDLPDDIRGRLTRLRRLRNKAVHEGLRDVDVNKNEIGELLCAAVFGFEFVRYTRKKLSEQRSA
ncbi:MAG: hypothetical protein HYY45_12895 [Deltaproteobacteria bacterium]|nr:hypothetical protein [Deltaproteobacteria bacterium]